MKIESRETFRPLYLGLDSGGTKTACVLLDTVGAVRGVGSGPGANLSHVDPAEFTSAIRTAVDEALEASGALPGDVDRGCVCLAGFAPEHEEPRIRALVDPILAPALCSYGRDLDAALSSACGSGPGVVVIAGTGSVASGRNGAHRTHRAGGWGYLIGDEGSAYFLGCQALRHTMHAFDGRAARGVLFDRVLAQAGVDNPELLDKMVYRDRWRPPEIAAYASVVTRAAAEGDPTATQLVRQAAADLAAQAAAVIQTLELTSGACGLVGGLWRAGPLLRHPFEAAIHRAGSRHEVRGASHFARRRRRSPRSPPPASTSIRAR